MPERALRSASAESGAKKEHQDRAGSRAAPVASGGLTLGATNDPVEAAADTFADSVAAGQRVVDRLGGSRPKARRAPTADGASSPVAPDIEADITSAIGRGSVLPCHVRSPIEQVAGRSIEDVRVHTDERAGHLARRLQARAFTVGSDVFFGAGAYRPGSPDGDHLIAHEVGHVLDGAGAIHRWPFGKKKAAGAAKPTSIGSRPLTLQEPVRAFPIGPDDVLDELARRETLPKGATVALLQVNGKPRKAKSNGEESAYVVCTYTPPRSKRAKRFAVDPAAVAPAGNKHVERAGKAGKAIGFVGETLGFGADSHLKSQAADQRVSATLTVGAAGNKGLFDGADAGEKVDYGSMSANDQMIYDKANFYDATTEAVSGAAGATGDWIGLIGQMKDFIDNWSSMNKKERANALANGFGSVLSTAASTSNFIAQSEISANQESYGAGEMTSSFGMRSVKVAGKDGKLVSAKEDYQATDMEKGSISLGLISGGVSAALEIKDAIVNFYKWAKKLNKRDEHGGLLREGVSTLQGFGSAAKSTMATIMRVKEFFTGASGVAAQAMPIFGLILSAIEVVKRGMDIHRARMDAVLVKAAKKASKSDFAARWGLTGKINRHIIRARDKELADELDDVTLTPKERAEKEAERDDIKEYFLDRDLANTADKRRNRAILGIVKEAQSIAANISTLAGQVHVSAAFSITGAATGLGAMGLRKLKQLGRDHGPSSIFNKNKTTEKKNERYMEVAETLYTTFIDVNLAFNVHLERQLHATYQPIKTAKDFDRTLDLEIGRVRDGDPDPRATPGDLRVLEGIRDTSAKLKGRVKAAGLSWREFCAERDPGKRFELLIAGQKKRE